MLTAGGAPVNDLGDAVARDPEVRQARMIAEAARTRLVACMSRPADGIDLTEAQGMLDALRNARALAGDAEDRVLLHRGLLTDAEADKRAAERHPGGARGDEAARRGARRGGRVRRDLRASRVLPLRGPGALPRPGGRRCAARRGAGVLVLAVLGVAVAVLARRSGVRPRLARR